MILNKIFSIKRLLLDLSVTYTSPLILSNISWNLLSLRALLLGKAWGLGKTVLFHTPAGQDTLHVWITVEGCHLEKKASVAHTSTKLCCTSTMLNDQETVKLSRNVTMPPRPKSCSVVGRELGTSPRQLWVRRLLSVTERSICCEAEQSSTAHWFTLKGFLQWEQHFCQSTRGHRSH